MQHIKQIIFFWGWGGGCNLGTGFYISQVLQMLTYRDAYQSEKFSLQMLTNRTI